MAGSRAGAEGLRILMVAARYLPFAGGIETHVREVSTRLVGAGHAVTVLTADPTGDLPRHEVRDGIAIERVRSWAADRDWCLAPGLYRRVAAGGVDVVHVQGYHTFSAPLAMAGALRAGVPFVLTFHSGGHSSSWRSSIRGAQAALLAPLARRAAHLIGVSRYEADRFSASMDIPRERFSVVPNGASLPPAAAAPGERDPTAPLVVSLGRLERYKGHHRAIAAFAKLREIRPGARLRILGEGPYEGQLRRMVDEEALADCVTIGAVPPDRRAELTALLQAASLVVLLSDYEAHPVAVMEALSLGLPVLTARGSGFDELAEQGLVRAVPADMSPLATARAMATAIADASQPDIRPSLPTWQACADAITAIYRQSVEMGYRPAAASLAPRPLPLRGSRA